MTHSTLVNVNVHSVVAPTGTTTPALGTALTVYVVPVATNAPAATAVPSTVKVKFASVGIVIRSFVGPVTGSHTSTAGPAACATGVGVPHSTLVNVNVHWVVAPC